MVDLAFLEVFFLDTFFLLGMVSPPCIKSSWLARCCITPFWILKSWLTFFLTSFRSLLKHLRLR